MHDDQRRWREHYEHCPYAGDTWFLPEDALDTLEEDEAIRREEERDA